MTLRKLQLCLFKKKHSADRHRLNTDVPFTEDAGALSYGAIRNTYFIFSVTVSIFGPAWLENFMLRK
jgi:hypothetical protein